MSGAFRTMRLPGKDVRETTRLELLNKEINVIAHLSAMTVQLGDTSKPVRPADPVTPDPCKDYKV